ncbi:hypothetical protein LTR29_008763 [Friedmanniomyces endolithicus]|nr:hypothetical protein LTR29_008763 [Friedmanniomyces endolithicus]
MADHDQPEDPTDTLNAEATLGTSPYADDLHPTRDEEPAPDNGSVPIIDDSYYILGFVTPPSHRRALPVSRNRPMNLPGQLPLLWDLPQPMGYVASAATPVHSATLDPSNPEEVTRRALSDRIRGPPSEIPGILRVPFLTIQHDNIRLQRADRPDEECYELFRGFVLESGPYLYVPRVDRAQRRADARALLVTYERPAMHDCVLNALTTIANDGFPFGTGLARRALLDEVQSMRALSPEPDSYGSQLMAVISQTLMCEADRRSDAHLSLYPPSRDLFTPDSAVPGRPAGIAIDLSNDDASYAATREQRDWAAAAFPDVQETPEITNFNTINASDPAPSANTGGRDYRTDAEIIQEDEDVEDENELAGYDLGLYNLQGLALSVNLDRVLEAQEELWEEHERWCSAVDWCRE